MSDTLNRLRGIVHDRKIVRAELDENNTWVHPQFVAEQDAIDAAVQRLADVGLTQAEVEEWLDEAVFRVEWPTKNVRRMYREEAAS